MSADEKSSDDSPSTNGRTAKGQFAKGYAGGPGNPFAKQAAQLRASLYAAVSRDDIDAIAKMLVTKAKSGDVFAAREVLDRTLGKSTQTVELSGPEGEPVKVYLGNFAETV